MKYLKLYSDFLNEKTELNYLDEDDFIGIISNEWGYDIIERIGGGSFGIAYIVKHPKDKKDKIIKITTDEEEAKTAYKLSKLPETRYLVNHYNVIRIKLRNIHKPTYAILMDYVEILNENERKIYDRIVYDYMYEREIVLEDLLDNKAFSSIKNDLDPECYEILDGLKKIVKEMLKYHLSGHDIHSDNLGWYIDDDGRRLVHFDISGYGEKAKNIKNIKLKGGYKYNIIKIKDKIKKILKSYDVPELNYRISVIEIDDKVKIKVTIFNRGRDIIGDIVDKIKKDFKYIDIDYKVVDLRKDYYDCNINLEMKKKPVTK